MSVLAALIAWPAIGSGSRARASLQPAAAAVLPDYLYRNKTIAFYEGRVARDPRDQISARALAQQYMQRYREAGDLGDIKRALAQARRSIKLQPGNNWGAYEILASGETAYHLFKPALRHEQYAATDRPDDPNALAQTASLRMELGQYDAAHSVLLHAARLFPNDASVNAVYARYDELTGNLADARRRLESGTRIIDSVQDNSAQARAWFHFREGEMAFAAGDVRQAEQDERDALTIFPSFAQAENALARFCWATKAWQCALDASTAGADLVPLPETLGYKADAYRAMGKPAEARATDDLIFAIERIGNAYHVSDRLLAVYYSDHGVRTEDAYRIARREISVRGDEIYAQDTLAWAAAASGHWNQARQAVAKALRYGTQDARIHYHAGVIEVHFGNAAKARREFELAIALNPDFHPFYADDARARLERLGRRRARNQASESLPATHACCKGRPPALRRRL